MCSGWGDRLIGAAAANCLYHGCDPNSLLVPRLRDCVSACEANATIFEQCVETFVPETEYDIAYTSPPYYDEEIYSNEATQSTRMYNTYNKWIAEFLHPMLNVAIRAVKPGGHIVMNIVDFRGCKLIQPTIDHMIDQNQTYKGIIWYRGSRNYLTPLLVFERERTSVERGFCEGQIN
jgi:hypothetical protein